MSVEWFAYYVGTGFLGGLTYALLKKIYGDKLELIRRLGLGAVSGFLVWLGIGSGTAGIIVEAPSGLIPAFVAGLGAPAFLGRLLKGQSNGGNQPMPDNTAKVSAETIEHV